jgi:MoaA/NifB/PqqE/SkfB family radical SAM enzyme
VFVTSFARYLYKRSLQHLILHVTNRCNYRCSHCFNDASVSHDLPLEVARAQATEIGSLFWLDIGGGEPFLHQDLPEIVAAFDAKVVMIPSNGYLSDRICDGLREIMKYSRAEVGLSLSLDGLQETNDRVRGEGSWDAVWTTFERVRTMEKVSLKINTVLSNHNQGELIEFMEEVRKHRPDFHSIILLRGTPRDSSTRLPDLTELSRLVPDIMRAQEKYDYGKSRLAARVLRNYHRYVWRLSMGILEGRTQVIPCLAGKAHMVIHADGSVSCCEVLPAIGSLYDNTWREILSGDTYRKAVAAIGSKRCFCTHNCALLDSILFSPRSLCRLVVGSLFP